MIRFLTYEPYFQKWITFPILSEIFLLVLLFVVSFLVRSINLSEIPYGAAWDETFYLSVIDRIVNGDLVGIFIFNGTMPDGTGFWEMKQPTGFMYIAAPFFLISNNIESVRIVSALFGALLSPLVYLFSKELFNKKIAIVSSILCIFCLWFMIQSRIAWPITPSMFFFILSVYLFLIGIKQNNIFYLIISAIIFASGVYIHKLYLPWFLFGFSVLFIAYISCEILRKNNKILLFLLLSLVCSTPILIRYIIDFNLYDYIAIHYNSEILQSPSLYGIIHRIIEILFLHQFQYISLSYLDGTGDLSLLTLIDKYNKHGYMLLSLHWLTCLLYWFGLIISLIFIKRRNYQILLYLYLISITSGIIAPGSEGRRLILALVFMNIYISIGLIVLCDIVFKNIKHIVPKYNSKNIIYSTIIVLFCFVFIFQQFKAFDYWANSGPTEWGFSADGVQFARKLNDFPNDYKFILYSDRYHQESPVITWFKPYSYLQNGQTSDNHTIDIDFIECDSKTVISLFDHYMDKIDLINNYCQNGEVYRKYHKNKDKLLYVLYVIE